MNRALNIGSGKMNTDVCDINLDVSLECNPTVCGSAEKLPFKGNIFIDVKAYHVLEHIPNIVDAMNECWRVLVEGGMLRTCVPMFPSVGSIADPTHIRYFIPETFAYFTEKGKLPGLKHTFKQSRVGLSKDKAQLFVDMEKRE